MSLITFHKIFIMTSILFCLGYSILEFVHYHTAGNLSDLFQSIGFALVFVILLVYLSRLRFSGRR